MKIGSADWFSLFTKVSSAYTKLIFAYCFEEDSALTGFKWIRSISGAFDIWFVNFIADNISDDYQSDLNVQFGSNVYPGSSTCQNKEDQSVFNEMYANGLLELVMAADQVNEMIRKGMQKQKYEYKPTDTPDKQYKFFKDYYDKAKLVNEDDDM